jgi:hypothetical protein
MQMGEAERLAKWLEARAADAYVAEPGSPPMTLIEEDDCRAAAALIRAQEAEIAELRKALEWYGEQARLCRIIHREGDAGRNALDADGGKRARAALGGPNG